MDLFPLANRIISVQVLQTSVFSKKISFNVLFLLHIIEFWNIIIADTIFLNDWITRARSVSYDDFENDVRLLERSRFLVGP